MKHHKFLPCFSAICLIAAGSTIASAQFFGASQTISGDTDVWTGGNPLWAHFEGAGTARTVNGVTFSPGNSVLSKSGANSQVYWGPGIPSDTNNNLLYNQATGNAVIREDSSSTAGVFAGLTDNYRSILSGSSVLGNNGDVTLSGLTADRAYVMQAWANNSLATKANNTRWFSNDIAESTALGDGNHTALAVNTGNGTDAAAVGSVGQTFLSTFTASGGTQLYDLACSNAIRLTAVQVRDVTGYWLGDKSGTWDDASNNFMGGMAFNDGQITTGDFVAFADLGLFEGTEAFDTASRIVALNRDISIAETGVSIGLVRFENDVDTYTFTNTAGVNGITDVGTSVQMDGTGRVVFNSANTYGGGTVVNEGTLVVNNTVGSGTGSGAVTIGVNARLEGSGIINGTATIDGTHAPGNSPGTQTLGDGVNYGSTSVFEWELIANTTSDRGTSWDAVNLTGGDMTVDSSAIFKIILNSEGSLVDFTDTFWQQTQTWDVFQTSGTATISSTFQNFLVTVDPGNNYDPSLGSFSMSGGTLTWSAVPEPANALAGLLMAAGLLRRRRMTTRHRRVD